MQSSVKLYKCVAQNGTEQLYVRSVLGQWIRTLPHCTAWHLKLVKKHATLVAPRILCVA